jgi:hypothetical protein
MPKLFKHRRQMRVICDVTVYLRNHRVHEPNQSTRSLKRADSRSITGPRNHVEPDRHYADVVISPDRTLQVDTLLKVLN